MTLFKNIVSDAGGNALGLVVQMGLLLVLARLASIEMFAVYLSANALIAVSEMASDFGTRILAVRYFSSINVDRPDFSFALGGKLFYAICALLIIPILPIKLLTSTELMLCAVIAITQTGNDPFLWYLQGRERFDLHALIVFIWRVLNAALLICILLIGYSVESMLWIWMCGNFARLIAEHYVIKLNFPVLKVQCSWNTIFSQTLPMAKLAFPIGVAFLLVSVFQRLGVFLLGSYSNPIQVALFGAVFSVVASSGFVGTSITLASFPMLSRAISSQQWSEASNIMRRKVWLISLIFVPACTFGMLLAPIVMSILFGEKYLSGVNVMIFLLAGLYISIVNFTLKYVLNALNRNWFDSASAALGIVVFCMLMLSVQGAMTAERAAIAWGCSELASFLFKWAALYMDKRLLSGSLLLTPLLSVFLAGLAATLTY